MSPEGIVAACCMSCIWEGAFITRDLECHSHDGPGLEHPGPRHGSHHSGARKGKTATSSFLAILHTHTHPHTQTHSYSRRRFTPFHCTTGIVVQVHFSRALGHMLSVGGSSSVSAPRVRRKGFRALDAVRGKAGRHRRGTTVGPVSWTVISTFCRQPGNVQIQKLCEGGPVHHATKNLPKRC